MMMKSFGVKDHDITVVGTEELAPHFRRIRFRADTLFSDAQPGATAWVRIWFPDNDPDNEGAEHQRAYTFTEANDDTGEFACDFVLHGPAGPASAWASTAAKGMTLQAQSNGSSVFEPDEDARRLPPLRRCCISARSQWRHRHHPRDYADRALLLGALRARPRPSHR